MNIDIKDLITLDDNIKYVVVSKVFYENRNYYYIIDKENMKNIKFVYEDNNELVEFDNKELLTKLLPLFYEKVKDELPIDN